MVAALIVLSVLMIGLIEFFIAKQRSTYYANKLGINNLSGQLEILKSLSFLYSSKNSSLEDVLNDLAVSFFMQPKLTTFILIITKDKTVGDNLNFRNIFRFSDNPATFFLPGEPGDVNHREKMISYLQTTSDSILPQTSLTPLEKYFLTNIDLSAKEQNKQILIVPDLQNTAKGFGINLNPKETECRTAVIMKLGIQKQEIGYLFFYCVSQISENDIDFLVTTGGVVALNIRKSQFDQTLDSNTQRKAVNVPW